MGIFSTLEIFMLKKKIHKVAELLRDYTTFFILYSTEHDIDPAHNY